jgi:hypothetical protein
MLSSQWSGILICPLFPLHATELPGYLFGKLLILHTWFKTVYNGKTHGLTTVWEKYVQSLLEFSEGASSLEQPEYKSPLMPSSLDINSPLKTLSFITTSTSPNMIFGFDREAITIFSSLSQLRSVEASLFQPTLRASSQGNQQYLVRGRKGTEEEKSHNHPGKRQQSG